VSLVRAQKIGVAIFGIVFVAAILSVSLLVSQSAGFVLAILGLLFVLVFLNIQLALLLVAATLLAGQLLRVFPIGVSGAVLLADLMMVSVATAWWLKQLAGRRQIFKTSLNVPIVFWLGLMVISLIPAIGSLGGGELLTSLSFVLRWAAYLTIFYILADLFQTNSGLKERYLNGAIIFASALSMLGFIQLLFYPDLLFLERFGWDPHFNRLVSTFLDPNLLGGFLVVVLGLAVAKLWYARDKKSRFWLSLAVAIILAAIFLTFSRSAWLALGVGFITFAWLRARWLILVGLAIGALAFVSPRVQERVEGAFQIDRSAQLRVESWQAGFEIMKAKPIIGVGANTLQYTRTQYTTDQTQIGRAASGLDSSLLTAGAMTGTLGLVAYLVLWGQIFLLAWRRFRSSDRFSQMLGLAAFASFTALLTHSFFVNSLFYPPVMVLVWFIMAMLVSNKEVQS